jgi:hypothetical protein
MITPVGIIIFYSVLIILNLILKDILSEFFKTNNKISLLMDEYRDIGYGH